MSHSCQQNARLRISFLFFGYLFALAFNLAVLLLVGRLIFLVLSLICLILGLEPCLGGLVDSAPHLADDLGQLCDFGGRVFALDIVIDLSPE